MGRKSREKKERREFEMEQQERLEMEQQIDQLLTDRVQKAMEEWQEMEKKGKKNEAWERIKHLNMYDGISEAQLVKSFKVQAYYALAMGGVPGSHTEVLDKPGWLLPYLFSQEGLFWGRWEYWSNILSRGTIEGSGPIPQIEWCNDETGLRATFKMLNDCVNYGVHYGVHVDAFADWLLWAFNMAEEPPRIPKEVNEYWYKFFNMTLLLKYPSDYMSLILQQSTSQGFQQAVGYYATPAPVAHMMAQLTLGTADPEKTKQHVAYEPCVGCGALLLPMSNFTLFGCGQDINPTAIKFCKIQMMLYAPWYAHNPLLEQQKKKQERQKEKNPADDFVVLRMGPNDFMPPQEEHDEEVRKMDITNLHLEQSFCETFTEFTGHLNDRYFMGNNAKSPNEFVLGNAQDFSEEEQEYIMSEVVEFYQLAVVNGEYEPPVPSEEETI